jgi:hypothetical protein
LKAEAYLSALALTLTLPDICGKAAYPEIKTAGDRYRKWYDEQIGKHERRATCSFPLLSYGIPYSVKQSNEEHGL